MTLIDFIVDNNSIEANRHACSLHAGIEQY